MRYPRGTNLTWYRCIGSGSANSSKMSPKISVGKHVLFVSSTGTMKVHLLAINTVQICHCNTNISDHSL